MLNYLKWSFICVGEGWVDEEGIYRAWQIISLTAVVKLSYFNSSYVFAKKEERLSCVY